MGALYLVTSPAGKHYVGLTVRTVEARWSEHVKRALSPRHALHRAIAKYGADAMTVKTLVIAEGWEYLCELERRAIAVYGSLAPNGYNMTSGGDGAGGLCAESREKARESLRRACANPSDVRRKGWAVSAAAMQAAIQDPAIEASRREKIGDTMRRKAIGRGTKNAQSRITEEQVREMRGLFGVNTLREIARLYGVSESLVSLIRSGKRWGHV